MNIRWMCLNAAGLSEYWTDCAMCDVALYGSTALSDRRRAYWEGMSLAELNSERGDAWRTNDGEAHTLARSYLALRGA